jgi:hypothetical protein
VRRQKCKRQKERYKQRRKELLRTEELILGGWNPTRIEWKVDGPGLEGVEIMGVDQSLGKDLTVVLTGTRGKDGTYAITPTTPGKYRITARIS